MAKPKFPMHDYHLHKSLRTCAAAVAFSLATTAAFYCLHHIPKVNKYKNFYSTYDPMASFERMREGGYLDSCPPSGAKN